MKISVITINFNDAKGLERTIKSVIDQTYQYLEYIIIDGGSTDNSVDVIKKYESRIDYWLSEPDKGIYNAMNKGITHANGDYCIFLNSGDKFFSNDALAKVISLSPSADIVSCDVVNDDNIKTGVSPAPNVVTTPFMLRSSLPHPSTLIKTNLIQVHHYREDYRIISDWIFFFEVLILKNYSYQHIQAPLTSFYLDGVSNTQKELNIEERRRYLIETFSKRIVDSLEDPFMITYLSSYGSKEYVRKSARFVIRFFQWINRHGL